MLEYFASTVGLGQNGTDFWNVVACAGMMGAGLMALGFYVNHGAGSQFF